MRFPFSQVNDILEEVNNKYCRINYGGCGIMAGILAQHLDLMVDEIKIVSYDSWGGSGNIDTARKKVNNNCMRDWERLGVGFSHIWVEFRRGNKWYAVDAEGIRTRAAMHHKWGHPGGGSFTVKEIKEISNNPVGWNDTFPRHQIPSMRNSMGRKFNNLFWY